MRGRERESAYEQSLEGRGLVVVDGGGGSGGGGGDGGARGNRCRRLGLREEVSARGLGAETSSSRGGSGGRSENRADRRKNLARRPRVFF